MIKKKALPTNGFELDTQNPVIQKMVIDFCRNNGIPVYEGTNGFDPKYPIVCWSPGENLITQRSISADRSISVEEFWVPSMQILSSGQRPLFSTD